jgi:hypothetical protein
MNSQGREKVRDQLQAALDGVKLEISNIAMGGTSIASEQELRLIAGRLGEMLDSLKTGKRIEVPGLWRIVTDTWPHTDKLRQQIVEAELSYERLK